MRGLSLQQSALTRPGFPQSGTNVSEDVAVADSAEARARVSRVRRMGEPDQGPRSISLDSQRLRSRRATVSANTTLSFSPVSARMRNRIGDQCSLSRVATAIARVREDAKSNRRPVFVIESGYGDREAKTWLGWNIYGESQIGGECRRESPPRLISQRHRSPAVGSLAQLSQLVTLESSPQMGKLVYESAGSTRLLGRRACTRLQRICGDGRYGQDGKPSKPTCSHFLRAFSSR